MCSFYRIKADGLTCNRMTSVAIFATSVVNIELTYCAPPPFCRGAEPPTKFSKRGGGLAGPQLLEGVVGKEGSYFFQGGLQFSHKE